MEKRIAAHLLSSASLKQQLANNTEFCAQVSAAAQLLFDCISSGQRVFACGNGGSAADSQHFVAELVGRFEVERIGLPAIALNTDSSILTAVGNDYGYEFVFSRQIEALGQSDDVLVAISTSGNSGNVLQAVKAAHAKNIKVIALTGRDGGTIAQTLIDGDVLLNVPSSSTARIQEVHITLLHCLADGLDHLLLGGVE